MKKLMILSLVFISAAAQANDSGCGLGGLAIQRNTKLSQLVSMTLNYSTLTQFFGITSGTSNCSANGIVFNDKEATVFAEANLPNLKIEMARGEGENLSAFAEILGCKSTSTFGAMTRRQYENIFPNADVTTENFLKSIRNEIGHDEALKSSCSAS